MSTDPFWSDEAIHRANQALASVPRSKAGLAVLKSIEPDVEARLDRNRRLATRLADSAQRLEEAKKAIMRHTLTKVLHQVSHLPEAAAVLEQLIKETESEH